MLQASAGDWSLDEHLSIAYDEKGVRRFLRRRMLLAYAIKDVGGRRIHRALMSFRSGSQLLRPRLSGILFELVFLLREAVRCTRGHDSCGGVLVFPRRLCGLTVCRPQNSSCGFRSVQTVVVA